MSLAALVQALPSLEAAPGATAQCLSQTRCNLHLGAAAATSELARMPALKAAALGPWPSSRAQGRASIWRPPNSMLPGHRQGVKQAPQTQTPSLPLQAHLGGWSDAAAASRRLSS